MSDWFYSDQLLRHLKSFKEERNKVLITIAPELMSKDKKAKFEEQLQEYNENHDYPVIHINTTFELLAEAVQGVIDDRDYEMQDVLDDYLNYCYNDSLILVPDSWKWMRVQLAGTTFDFNIRQKLYYDDIDRGFRAHDYLGLYKEKSVRAIGRITDIITAVLEEDGEITYSVEKGEIDDNKKKDIAIAIEDGKNYGYSLTKTRFFFVDKFYETDFRKTTPRAPMGSRVFDLTQVMGVSELPDTSVIAEKLKSITWG